MTEDEILALPAGRELDALIAEKVMGWHPGVYTRSDGSQNPSGYWSAGETGVRLVSGYDCQAPIADYETCIDCGHEDPAWSPSTDMGHAWEVWLNLMGRLFSVRQKFYDALQGLAHMKAGGSYVLWPDVLTVLRHDFPLAICQAALAVLETNKEELQP